MSYRLYTPTIQPGFLRGPYGQAWGNAFGIVKDFFADLTKQGVQQRFVEQAQGEALAAIGAERGIPQGVNESSASYVESLMLAWSAWQLAGTPWSILALMNFLGYANVYLVTQNGLIYGPSEDVQLPNPNTGFAGVPPAVTSSGQKWTFAVSGNEFDSQGPQYVIVPGSPFTWEGYWLPNTAYAGNAAVYANPPNGCWYVNLGSSGTSGAAPPIFPAPFGESVTDGPDIIWYSYGNSDAAPVGQQQGTVSTNFWSAYILVFDPPPLSWTNIQNPPTSTSSPTLYEIDAISTLISNFNAGYATCCGFYVPMGGTRAGYGWPVGRTNHGDCNWTEPSGVGPEGVWTLFWQPVTAWYVGAQVIPTQTNGYWYKCTTTGTGGYVEPTWPTTIGDTVSDGTATWTCEGTTNSFETGTTPYGTVFQFEDQQAL